MRTCLFCKTGELRPGHTTLALERNGVTVVVKSVPAMVCENCGEAYVEEEVTHQLLKEAEAAVGRGAEVEVRHYLAA